MRGGWTVLLVLGCGSGAIDVTRDGGHGPSRSSGPTSFGSSDGSAGDLLVADSGSSSTDAAADLAVRPTPDQCFMGWATFHGKCPAPIITRAGVTNDCDGAKGWEVLGA